MQPIQMYFLRKMRDFKQLKIWQKGLEIAVQTFRFVATMPKTEQFGLCTQMTRAAVSITSNIAEGSSRSSVKDYNRFVEIALGSSYELETQVLITQATAMGNPELCIQLLGQIREEQKMLVGFQKSLMTGV